MKKTFFCLLAGLTISLSSCSNSNSTKTTNDHGEEKSIAAANKDLIRNYFNAIDIAGKTFNADTLDNFIAEDFVEHNPFPGVPANREGWKQIFEMFANGAPGYHIIDDLIAEGDKVAGRVTAYGKHTGILLGIPPTNKDLVMTGISIWRVKEGKIIEHWRQTDQVGLMTQLGMLPLKQ